MSKRLMGKLSSFGSIDIIPITSGAPKNSRLQHNLKKKFKKMKKNRLHLSDPKIIERVRQYLEENVDQTYVDVNLMAQILRKKYMEYSRRKEVPFRSMVESAYKAVMHSYGLDSDQSSDGDDNDELDDLDESDDDDLQVMGGNSSNNQLNSSIQAMYMQNQKNTYSKAPASMDNDCIDIVDSSDESDGGMMGYDKHKAGAPLYHQYPDSVTRQLTSRVPNLEIRSKRGELEEHNVPAGNSKSGKSQRKRKVPEGGMTDIEKIRFKKKKVDSTTAKPSVSFKHIGGIDNILKDLCDMLIHLKHPEVYRHLGTKPPRGFLLHGPPGCGKTLLANSIAGKLGVPMIGVVATELVAGVSGESEERIRELFDKAVSLAPCVLFIDEVDVISANRMNAQKDMERRIVAQLISSMDGLGQKENGDGVLVIGATNSVDSLDPSLRRVGRFDQEICLGIPDQKARASILKVVCSNLKLQPNFDFDNLAKLTPGYVGADLLALSSKAASNAVKRVFVELKEEDSEPTIFTVDDKETDIVPKTSEQIGADVEIVENKQTIDPQTIDLDDTDVEEKMLDDSVELVKKPTENGTVKEGETVELDDTDTTTNNVDEQKDDTTKTINKEPEDSVVDISKADDTTKADDILKEVETTKSAELVKPVDEKVVDEEATVVEKNDVMEIKETEPIEEDKPANKLPKAVVEEIEEKMSLGSPLESGDVRKSSGLVKQWTLAEMEALIDNPEPPLSEKELKNLCITMQDFELALKTIQPSAKREGFITVPNVTWDEIGSLQDIRQELQMAILAPVRYPDRFASLGLTAPSGVLLCGPPGCGKTLLAKAIANEAGVNFISVKGPELLNMYVGESERAVRQCFTRARNSAPCVIFFDEFDSLCPKRSDSSQGGVSSRVVNQLLTEMDGVEGRFGVFLMAATNRPDIVDPAVMRPGRLDKILYVGLPNEDDRLEILKAITKNGTQPVLHSDVDLAAIASSAACSGYTGADLAGLVRQASMQALRESMDAPELPQGTLSVTHLHFLQALAVIRPSVSAEDRRHYEKLRKKYATVPTAKENGDGIYIEPMDDS